MEEISKLLIDIHLKLKELKKNGVKMKDVAEKLGFPPSVLSALSSTVLPTYEKSLESMPHEEAFNYAIAMVNNVSKRRLLENLSNLHDNVMNYGIQEMPLNTHAVPYLNRFIQEASHANTIKGKVDGIYMSYSQPSTHGLLKMEPYMLQTTEEGKHIVAKRVNTSGSMHQGFAIFKEHKALHIMFNESNDNFFAPVCVMMQLPFVEDYHIIKGLYLSFDVASNPIARRVVLQKISESTDMETFLSTAPQLIPLDQLSEEQAIFANYACCYEDALRMCSVPSRGGDTEMLKKEKEILALLR